MATATKIVKDLERNAEQVAKAEEKLAGLKTVQDGLVKDAREADVSYGDIGGAIGKCFSWINASLVRSGGARPRAGRPRKK